MTRININGVKLIQKDIAKIQSARFDFLGDKVYSAEKIQRMFGVFVSQPIETDSSFISWKDLSWVAQKVDGTDIHVYIKVASSESALESAEWIGPYLNADNDISNLKDRYLQFLVVLENDGSAIRYYDNIAAAQTPIFDSISLSYFSSQDSVKFYTRAFNLGFVPKHVLLTYNGDVSSDSIVRFAVSGFDTIDPNDYQYIDPNKVEELNELSLLSNKIKVLIEMIGDNDVPVTIHEFALMFSGDDQLRLNKISSSSSSESSSSSSSESSESSGGVSQSSTSSSSSESSSSSSEGYSESSSSSSSAPLGIGRMIIQGPSEEIFKVDYS